MGLLLRSSNNSNHPHGRALRPTKALLQVNAPHNPAVQAVCHRSRAADLLRKVSHLKVTLTLSRDGRSHQVKVHLKVTVALLMEVPPKASYQLKVHHLPVCEAPDLCLIPDIQDLCLLLALVTEALLPQVATGAHPREASLPKVHLKGVP